jgi:hypothetical protein
MADNLRAAFVPVKKSNSSEEAVLDIISLFITILY